MANNFPELKNGIELFVRMAESAENEMLHLETWQVKSLLTGKFERPGYECDSTEQDVPLVDDTGDLSNSQIEAILMRDRGEMETQKFEIKRAVE